MTKNRRIVFAFFASVIVNLALVAYVVGNHIAEHRSNTGADPSYALSVMMRSLPPERIEELMPDYLKRLRADVRPHYDRLSDAQARCYRALSAKEVNREQLERAIDDYWLIRNSAQSIADSVFVEMVVQLSTEERVELLRGLRQVRARYEEWRRSRIHRGEAEREETENARRDTNSPREQTEES